MKFISKIIVVLSFIAGGIHSILPHEGLDEPPREMPFPHTNMNLTALVPEEPKKLTIKLTLTSFDGQQRSASDEIEIGATPCAHLFFIPFYAVYFQKTVTTILNDPSRCMAFQPETLAEANPFDSQEMMDFIKDNDTIMPHTGYGLKLFYSAGQGITSELSGVYDPGQHIFSISRASPEEMQQAEQSEYDDSTVALFRLSMSPNAPYPLLFKVTQFSDHVDL
jgi:hypothetical protein